MDSIDRRWAEALSGHDWPLVTPFAKALSGAGGDDLVWIAIAVVLAVRMRRLLPLGALALALIPAELLSHGLKAAIDRPRPSISDAAVHPLVAVPASSSMPSGHALTSFAAAVALGAVAPRARPWLLALAAMIAASRVYLGLHYPGDVIVGAAIGAAVGLCSSAVLRRLVHHEVGPDEDGDRRQQGDEDPV